MNQAAKGVLQFAIIGLIMAGAVVAVFEAANPFPKEGKIAVYFAYAAPQVDIQGDQYIVDQASPATTGPPDRLNVKSLEVTIDSVQVHSGISDETGWTEVSSGTVTLDLIKSSGESVLLGLTNIAEQNITMVRMHVASAAATVEYSNGTVARREVKVPSSELKIPLMAEIRGQLTTRITITSDPQEVHIVMQTDPIILRPTILLNKVEGPE